MTKFGSLKRDDEQKPKLVKPSPDGTIVSSSDTLPTPPDGGWGWMVVLGSFMIHVIADGVAYSFGIFLGDLIEHFDAGRGDVGWISSLMVGITYCSGPVVSALTNKYGCRAVSIAGSILSAFGFAISVFAPNLYYLYFTFGIISGLGLGMIYLPAIVSVTYYFEKRRSFATGLAVCGSGIGTFIFAPLAKALLDEYGWKGATLIEAGLLLNCCIWGAFFRPLEFTKRQQRKPLADCSSNDNLEGATAKDGAMMVAARQVFSEGTLDTHHAPLSGALLLAQNSSSLHSLPHMPGEIMKHEGTMRRHASEMFLPTSRKSADSHHLSRGDVSSSGMMYRRDIFYSGSLANIHAYRSNPVAYAHSITSLPQQVAPQDECFLFRLFHCSEEMKGTFRQMLDLELLKDGLFLLFAISNLFTSIGFSVPYIYLPDRAQQMGISKSNAAFLISVIGISNTVGRVVFGWLSDRECINRLFLYNTALALCGIATSLSIFCLSYEMLVVYAAIFGLFIGVYVSLTSVVLVDLLGIERLTNSFGLLLLFQGVATIVGPPVAGWIYDMTQSYDVPFIITGAVIAFSGVMLFSLPCIKKLRDRRRGSEQDDISTKNDLTLTGMDA